MKGGKRSGAGRKKGSKASHTIEAEEARKIIIARVSSQIEPIVQALIGRALDGEITAARVLFERAFGRIADSAPPVGDQVVNITMYGDDDRLLQVMRKRLDSKL